MCHELTAYIWSTFCKLIINVVTADALSVAFWFFMWPTFGPWQNVWQPQHSTVEFVFSDQENNCVPSRVCDVVIFWRSSLCSHSEAQWDRNCVGMCLSARFVLVLLCWAPLQLHTRLLSFQSQSFLSDFLCLFSLGFPLMLLFFSDTVPFSNAYLPVHAAGPVTIYCNSTQRPMSTENKVPWLHCVIFRTLISKYLP